jgi:UDP-3-O-[3-hydroxymyristoyl] glucosamine N-acyltransferase
MIDARFYEALGPMTVRALAPSADIGGDADRLVSGAAPADRAGPEDLCYFEGKRGAQPLTSAPAVCMVTPAQAHLAPNAGALILTDRPRSAFARLISQLLRPRELAPGGPAIDPSVQFEEGVKLGFGVVIGPGAQIGAGAEIGPNSVIGPGVAIGRRTRIGARVTIAFTLIGDEANILSGGKELAGGGVERPGVEQETLRSPSAGPGLGRVE